MYYEVVPAKSIRANFDILTYSSDLSLRPGHIVRIPLGRSKVNGIVLRKVAKVDFPTKPIEKLLYTTPLPPHLLKSLRWLSSYYLSPLPAVATLLLPTGVEKKRKDGKGLSNFSGFLPDLDARKCISLTARSAQRNDIFDSQVQTRKIALNPSQTKALHSLTHIPSPTKLLHGITGSGKTNIYLSLAQSALKKGKSVILLVPEISLTSQLVQIFCSTFSRDITLIHSRQTEAERHLVWEKLLNSTKPEIVIGPRSALLAPLKNLGLIIVDEAHESAYYQENTPKYSALRLASQIATTLKIDCILGTATPLIADYYLASAKSSLVTLSTKAKSSAITPDIHLINLADRQSFQKNRYFSSPLLESIEKNLQAGHQTLIFHNRRGSAPLTICEKCAWQALCPACFLPLTLHSDNFELHCHTCGFTTKLPHSCPSCGHPSIIHKGFGTKLLGTELTRLFPDAKIVRFDADNKKSESLDQLYEEIKNGDYQIIIGTQTIAKGLDLPKLATVGVIQADSGLSLPDFAAEERSFHLLTQVIGRVGRGHLDTAEVFIQTYQPDHPVIKAAIKEDYSAFYSYLLGKRRQGHLPPYFYLAKLHVTFKTESTTLKKISAIHQILAKSAGVQVSPPTPAFHEHTTSGFTWQLILKAKSRQNLLSAVEQIPPQLCANLHITLDPPSLL